MSATEELRRLLDERGVDYDIPRSCKIDSDTTWHVEEIYYDAFERTDGAIELTAEWAYELTPEQAIAATLGGGECVPHGKWESISQTQEVRHVFCECGYELGMDRRDSLPFERTQLFAMPNFCQECGRKILKAVKR